MRSAYLTRQVAVEKYLKSSGLPNAFIHVGWFLENFWTNGLLAKTPTGFDKPVANYRATDVLGLTWIEHDVPAAVLALLKNYTDPSKAINGRTYPANLPLAKVAAKTAKAGYLYHRSADGAGCDGRNAHAEYSGMLTATPATLLRTGPNSAPSKSF
ncbi:hypothetical protein DFH07DRAFT_2424 [Mycena maculata]|uniref:NmrA-like domain-containing protein n=1 Tax=Mycena maculata TaxID=230809 RepID=A0AAD7KGA8_9AGAR|nr:hypothetical protein DFH07DRAFT_2424 [Mycena maculata]